jgi:hypothetical protein
MRTKTALLILLAGLSAFSSRAAQVITTSYSNLGFFPDTSQDLILNVLPASTGATPNLVTSGADPQMYTLVDGQTPIQIPNYNGNNLLQNGVVLVWDMGAPATINSIYTYSDWPNNGRVIQDYTVDVSEDGTNWTNGVVAVVNQGTAASGNWPSVEVAVTTDDASPLATNVRFIRFNFPSTQNGGVGYMEFVVNGVSFGLPEAPVFTVIPQSQTVTNGNSVTFTAHATGFPPPLIKWHFIDTSSVDNLLSTVGDTLTFQVSFAKEGQYYAEASNPSGITNSTPAAVLTVIQGLVTETDDNSGFPFTNPGTDDLILGNSGTSIALNNFDTQNGWTVANLTDGDAQGPLAVGNGAGVYTLIGNNATITYNLGTPCTVTGVQTWTGWAGGGRDNQNYTVLYSTNGTDFITLWTVANNPNQGYGNSVLLTINNLPNVVAMRFNFGNQQNGGVAYNELAVYGVNPFPPQAPEFTVIPQSQTVTNNQSVTFTAEATGTPLPTMTWHFVDTSSVDHVLTLGNTLTIPVVNIFTDVGHYYVEAKNASGTTNSPWAQLTVIPNGVVETDLKLIYGETFAGLGANDLILNNAGDASALSYYEPTGGWTPVNLTDGDLKEPGTIGNGTGVYGGISSGNVTYNLGGGPNGAGYDLSGAEVWTSWNGDRVNPNFIFSYSYDGVNFIKLQTVYVTGVKAPGGADISLAIDVIHNVRSVRFTFPGTQQNGWVSYTELAAYGQASTGGPRALSAARDYWGTQVSVFFTQPLDPTTATNALNYTIDNGATVRAATMSTNADGVTTVVLTTSPLTAGPAYVLTITNVQDLAANTIAPNPTQLPIAIPVTSDTVRAQYNLGGTDLLVLEAEHYNARTPATDGHAWVFTNTSPFLLPTSADTNVSGTGLMITTPDNGGAFSYNPGDRPTGNAQLDYKVYFPAAGVYTVWVRGSGDTFTPGVSDSVNLGLDGVLAYRLNNLWPATNGYTWGSAPTTPTSSVLTVPTAGLHVFNLWMREDGFAVDKVVLTPTNSIYTPTGTGPAESPGPGITVTPITGGKLELSWPAGGILQSSTNVVGTYTDIGGSSSPWQITPTGVQKYYRVRQ